MTRVPASDRSPSNVRLHLRGGFFNPYKEKNIRKLGDDERLPSAIWFFIGGDMRQTPPTGAQLREWKRESDGNWTDGKKRSFFQEIAFVLSRGKMYHNQPEKNEEDEEEEEEMGLFLRPSSPAGDSVFSGTTRVSRRSLP